MTQILDIHDVQITQMASEWVVHIVGMIDEYEFDTVEHYQTQQQALEAVNEFAPTVKIRNVASS